MSQITRCPACSTQFKVVADQLRISEGWVRCGKCAEVFDASASLMPAPPPALLPDVSLTDVRPPPQPVARVDESTRAWGAPPAPAPVAAKVPAVAPPHAAPVVSAALAAPSVPAGGPVRAQPQPPPQPPAPDVLAVPDPVLPAFLAATPAGGRDGRAQGVELGLEPLTPFGWGGAPAAPAPRHPPQVVAPVPPPVQPVIVERQESRILSADMLELVLQGTRATVPVAVPEAPIAAQETQAPVPLPGGYELPYAEDFADTALLPEALAEASEVSEVPQGPAVPVLVSGPASADGAAAAPQAHAPYPPLDLPAKPPDPSAQPVVKAQALGAALRGVQGPPAEPPERWAVDWDDAWPPKKRSKEATDGDVGRDAVAEGETASASALPSVAFPSLPPESVGNEPPSPSSAATEPQDGGAEDGADTIEDEAPTEDVSFVKAARRRAFWRRPWVRVALVAVWLGLLAALAGQVAVHERNRLAAMEPRLRPALLALCEPLECTLAPQRQISDVVIDSSSFNKARGDSYVLAITMKSRATLPLEMPAVELTLTDAQDQPVLRRVLLPAEMSAPQELPAGGEWNATVSVLVTTGGARVAGYRLLAFYP